MEKVSACVIFQPVDARSVLSLTFCMAELTACGMDRVIHLHRFVPIVCSPDSNAGDVRIY